MAAPKGKDGGAPPAGGAAPPPRRTKHRRPEGNVGEPSVHIKMAWAAVRGNVSGGWLFEGISISFPTPVAYRLREIGAPADHNTIIVPMPADLVDGIHNAHPQAVKKVSGRLPDLVLYPIRQGNNEQIWADYRESHRPKSEHISDTDFAHRTLKLPSAGGKAKKE